MCLDWREARAAAAALVIRSSRPLIGYLCVDDMRHNDHTQACDPQSGHIMSDMHGSHDRHAGHSVAMFRDKFWLSFALTIPIVFWSTDVQHWLGYTAPSFPGSKFIPAILGTVVFVYGGLVFVRGAWGELADHKPGMMTLISLAIMVAFGTSLAATFGLFEIDVWWEVASLITIMVLGHWLEMRAISQARGALDALAALLPDTAERINGTDTRSVPLSELRVGDIVLVRPGARVPADGIVAEGSADVAFCGERVGLLWAEGKTDAAIRLEQLCSDLAKIHEVDILCAYPLSSIHGKEHERGFQKISAQHSTVYSQ